MSSNLVFFTSFFNLVFFCCRYF